jgi:hypothetical protein
MVMQSVLICVHGYTRAPKVLHRPWEDVMLDRLTAAYKLSEFLHSANVTSYLILSGGVVSNGEVEADKIYEFAKRKLPGLFELVTDVILERESKNTQENVDEIIKWAKKKNAAIIAVSSKDHAPRIAKDWAYDKNRKGHLIMIAPSEESYSESGSMDSPIIIEPPFWAYESLKDIFNVPANKVEEVKRKIAEIIGTAME